MDNILKRYNESNILELFYPYLPDWTEQVGKGHLIACFDVQKIEIVEQTLDGLHILPPKQKYQNIDWPENETYSDWKRKS